LVGVNNPESGQFLNAIPSSNLGLHLGNEEISIAISIRTGCEIVDQQQCANCHDQVHPDGVTILPWKNGKRLVWDVTCSDSFATTYRHLALSGSGQVAEAAEKRKLENYKGLNEKYIVQPVAFDTLGAFGPQTREFISTIGKSLIKSTGDRRAASFLRQRISVEIQRANSWSIIESLEQGTSGLRELEHIEFMEKGGQDKGDGSFGSHR